MELEVIAVPWLPQMVSPALQQRRPRTVRADPESKSLPSAPREVLVRTELRARMDLGVDASRTTPMAR